MRPVFDPFVIPFVLGMIFVLCYCVIGLIRVIAQLTKEDRKKFLRSLIKPRTIWLNIRDLFGDCLFHVKIWKRKPILGYMHSSIAFGWFMIIVIGHFEVFSFSPIKDIELPLFEKLTTILYFPIFFRYFAPEGLTTLAKIYSFLMDFFLLLIISGILIAALKKWKSRVLGVKRVTKFDLKDSLVRWSLWTIFPLRFLAESTTAGITGGSFLTSFIGFNGIFGGGYDETFSMVFWWLYSIDLCIFMFILPFSRYMHIPTEMVFILMRHAGLKAKEPRKGYSLVQLYSCPGCGLCIDACPMSVNDTKSKNTSVYFLQRLRKGDSIESQRIAETCLMCGKCVKICPVSVESCDIKLTQRLDIKYNIKSDFSYLEHLKELEAEQIEFNLSKNTQKVLYYAGCMSQLTPSITLAMTNIMRHAGEEFDFLDKDGGICCGRPLMLSGKFEEAKQLIAKNTELIKKSGAKRLVLSCPICYKVFKEEYHLEGVEILHHTQYINDLMKKGRLKVKKSDVSYVYHDPCELGRGFGIYEEPREALKRLGILKGSGAEKELSICCGGSLGSMTLSQKERNEITASSLDNLMINHPDEIVTACPLCLKTFGKLAKIKVRDIAEVAELNAE